MHQRAEPACRTYENRACRFARRIVHRGAEGSGTRHDLFQACARAGFAPRVVVEVGDASTMEHMVGTGDGIALVPESMCTYGHPDVARIPLSDQITLQRTVGLVYPRNTQRNGTFSELLRLATQLRDNRNRVSA